MLKEIAGKYYKMGYNCAESTLRAGNDVYDLGLSDHDMKMAAGFGGGLQVGDICGVLSAASCIVSMRYVETKAHDYEKMKPMMQQLVMEFQRRMGSRLCSEIKPVFHTEENKCLDTVLTGAEVIEEFIEKWDKE